MAEANPMEDKRKRAVDTDDPVKRGGNDEREDPYPYGGDRQGARAAKRVSGPKPIARANSSRRRVAAPAGAKPSTRRKPAK